MTIDYRLAKTIVGKAVISTAQGQQLGKVEDLYLDSGGNNVTALYLGAEGLINRKHQLIGFHHIDMIGIDVVLVSANGVVESADETPDAKHWTRMKDLIGRKVDTGGGTPIGKVSDLILDGAGNILGFALSNISVEGPVATHKSVTRQAVLDMGQVDGGITINMRIAEEQALSLAT